MTYETKKYPNFHYQPIITIINQLLTIISYISNRFQPCLIDASPGYRRADAIGEPYLAARVGTCVSAGVCPGSTWRAGCAKYEAQTHGGVWGG